MILVVHPGSWFFTHPESLIQGSKGHRIPDPDPQNWRNVSLDLSDDSMITPQCFVLCRYGLSIEPTLDILAPPVSEADRKVLEKHLLSYSYHAIQVPTVFIIQCFGSVFIWYGSGFSILGWIRIRIQDFDVQKLEEIYSWKRIILFFDQKLPFVFPLASVKDVKATEEALSPQKRTSSISKCEIS